LAGEPNVPDSEEGLLAWCAWVIMPHDV